MQTAQVHIALALVSSLTPEEIQAFAVEFGKRFKSASQKPKKVKKKIVDLPETSVLAMEILNRHRSKQYSRAR